jgi:uncharacterized protein (TIGR02996 family)
VSSPQAALLQAILDDPDDDVVRLVFADWCEEDGQADRAEFIRLQFEEARKQVGQDASETKLSAREKALLRRHARTWFAPPRGWKPGNEYKVRRGFPWAVTGSYQAVHDQQETLARWPITRLNPYLNQPEHARLLAEATFLPRIRELGLYYLHFGAEVLRVLVESPSLAGLQWLNAGSCALEDVGAAVLAYLPHLPRLRHLDLRNNDITSVGMQTLIESEQRGAIESLVLCGNRVSVGDACALLAAERWTNLTDLDLWNTGLGDSGVARLAACPALSRLTGLNLNHNGITENGVRALAASPHARNLRSLALSANDLTSACAEILIDSPHLRGLKHLRLAHNPRIHWRKRQKLEEHFGAGVTFDLL